MPTIITDQDVLAQIAIDDEIAADVDAAFTSIASTVGAGPLLAWQSDLAAYRAWAATTSASVSGGFFGGAWFGVPDAYSAAVNWGQRLKQHAADAAAGGAVVATLPPTPAPSAPSSLEIGGDTKLLIGLGLVLLLLVAVKR